MSLAPGTRLGAYEVIALLGAGGMGEVYRARDTRLNRDVAVKILPDSFASDPERVARFQREAQVLASLNHPNIAQIHGFEDAGTTKALVLELVEGPTLADLIAKGPIPLDEALPTARQIAEALEAAHEHGIIHRDLKPANIKLTPNGIVKVLDFGLAKTVEQTPGAGLSPAGWSQSPTITSPAMTQANVILGTATYMSPEQARGKVVDKRADIWAFGCVLYEMLTGTRAFDGNQVADVLALILTKDPDGNPLPASTPLVIRKLLTRCLEKDRRKRLADIADARLDIEEALAAPISDNAAIAGAFGGFSPRRVRAVVAVSVLLTASVSGTAIWFAVRGAATRPAATQRFAVPLPSDVSYPDDDGGLAISPDGNLLVYPVLQGGKRLLYARPIDQLAARPIRGTEDAYAPFFSPDGQWIAFFTDPGAGRGTLKKVPVHGGSAIPIASAPGAGGGVWAGDGAIIFAAGRRGAAGLHKVSATGGQAMELTNLGNNALRAEDPDLLPDGETVLFSVSAAPRNQNPSWHIAALSLRTGQVRTIIESGQNARFVPSGHIVYTLDRVLMAAPFDARQLQTTGPAVPVIEDLRLERGYVSSAGFAVSPTGFLVYAAGSGGLDVQRMLVWVDRQGQEEPLAAPPQRYASARLSPDGSRIALDVREQENDIWVYSLERKNLTPVTSGPLLDRFPIWAPDGKHVLFGSQRMPAGDSVYSQAADGSGDPKRLTPEISAQQFPQTFAPDGSLIYIESSLQNTEWDLHILTPAGASRPLLRTPFREWSAEVSPDGRWLAYASDDSGQNEVYVRPFPNVEAGRILISTGGGFRPLWARNGRELFYMVGISPDPVKIMAVSVEPGSGFGAGPPRLVLEGRYYSSPVNNLRTYDISPDGQRFLLIKDDTRSSEEAPPAALVVVLNWFDELKRLVPPRK